MPRRLHQGGSTDPGTRHAEMCEGCQALAQLGHDSVCHRWQPAQVQPLQVACTPSVFSESLTAQTRSGVRLLPQRMLAGAGTQSELAGECSAAR